MVLANGAKEAGNLYFPNALGWLVAPNEEISIVSKKSVFVYSN